MNIDVIIFIGFLAINLIVGLSYGRQVNTIKDYVLGGRNFSTTALVSTTVATLLTGSGFFVLLSKTYSDGLSIVIASSSQAIAIVLTALFFIPRMGEFMGSLSVAEVMGNLYGKQVRFITAICGILWIIGSIAVQFKVFGNLFNYFLGIKPEWAISIAATVTILYSAFGGVRAITYTDVLQFFTFGFVIPLIGILIWSDSQSANLTLNTIFENPKFDINTIFSFDNPNLTSFILLILYFSVPIVGPIEFQRISMGRDLHQVKIVFLISAVLFVLIKLFIAWIPIMISTLKPGLEPTQIVSYIINSYTYTGLKGLLIIGVSAMAMSSADSFINSSSVLFGHDLKEVCNIKIDNLILSKIFALLLGALAIYLALSTNDLLSMVMMSASFYMPIVAVPLMLSIIGFRSSTKSVLISMAAGLATVLVWYVLKIELEVIIPAMLINLIFLFGSHYLLKQPGGWVGSKDTTYLVESRRKNKKMISNIIAAFSFSNILASSKRIAPKNELMYVGFGIYCIFYTFSTMYSTQVELMKENGRIILTIYQIMMVTGVVTAMYPIWPARIKKEVVIQLAWNVMVFYMLIFFSCFFVMVSDFGQLQFTIFTINMLIAGILVGWRLSAGMIIVGFYLSAQFYKFYAGLDSLDISIGSPQFIFMYSLMLVGSALIIFLKPKQEYQALTEEKNEHLSGRIGIQEEQLKSALEVRSQFIRNVTHEYNAPMTGIISMAETLVESYHKLSDEQRLVAAKTILESSRRFDNFDSNLSSLAKFTDSEYKLNLERINFSNLVHDRVEICRKLYDEEKDERKFEINIEEGINVEGDIKYLAQALDNLIINAINYCKFGKITIDLEQFRGQVHLSIIDEGIGIPTNELENIFNEFIVSSKTLTPAGGRGVGLAVCRLVIKAHGGSIKAESNGEMGATFKVVLKKF